MQKPKPKSAVAKDLSLDLRRDNLKYHYTQRGPLHISEDIQDTFRGRLAIAINIMLDHSDDEDIQSFFDRIGITEDWYDGLCSGDITPHHKVYLHFIVNHDINALFLYTSSCSQVWCGS